MLCHIMCCAAPGRRELVAADSRGNVAAFTPNATELWERHVGSNVAQARPALIPGASWLQHRKAPSWSVGVSNGLPSWLATLKAYVAQFFLTRSPLCFRPTTCSSVDVHVDMCTATVPQSVGYSAMHGLPCNSDLAYNEVAL